MKNKRVLMLLALTAVLSVSMTACNFGGGSDEDSSVVQVTPTPEPTKAAKAESPDKSFKLRKIYNETN